MKYNGKTLTVKKSATTSDIINALEAAIPTAVKQVKDNAEIFPASTGNPIKDAKQAAEFVRDNVKYKADGYLFQDIQLPTRMFAGTKKADCKSFALASLAQILAAGHKGGFRFASYRPNKIPTHVYFYVLDNSGKKHSFDPCIANLKESNKATNIIDMELRYMTGLENEGIGRKRKRGGKAKKITLAPARQGYLAVVRLNFRGLATKQAQLLQKNPKDLEAFWTKLGGKFSALKDAVNAGKNKRPLLIKKKGVRGYEDYYIGEEGGAEAGKDTAGTIAKYLPFIAPLLTAIAQLFKKNKIDDAGTIEPGEEQALDPTGEGFEAADPETGAKTTPTASTSAFSFQPSPLMIGGAFGAIALIYLLTSKKRR